MPPPMMVVPRTPAYTVVCDIPPSMISHSVPIESNATRMEPVHLVPNGVTVPKESSKVARSESVIEFEGEPEAASSLRISP